MANKFSRSQIKSVKSQIKNKEKEEKLNQAKKQIQPPLPPPLPEGIDPKDERVKTLLKKGFKIDEINPAMLSALDNKPVDIDSRLVRNQIKNSLPPSQAPVLETPFQVGDLVIISNGRRTDLPELNGIVLGIKEANYHRNVKEKEVTVMTKEGKKYVRATALRKKY